MACDPNSPRASPLFRRTCDNLVWFPFAFILSLLLYTYLTLTLSLAIGYTLLRKHSFIKALFQFIFSTLLAGGATWSFLVAVFKHPGSPRPAGSAATAALEEGEAAYRRQSEPDVGRHSTAEDDEYQDEGQGERTALLDGDGDGDGDGNVGEQGPLPPLLSAPLPGQAQVPARSGRQQLSDHVRLTSHLDASASARLRSASDIWVKSTGESRWCAKCNAPKPDRCHHCSSCRRCVLRMDHHCPWLASRCIGLRNHKAFFLFLSYTALLCIYATQEAARALVEYVESEVDGYESSPIAWAVVLFMGFIFGCTLAPFAAYHAYLILKNRTTLEAMEGSGRVRLRARQDPKRDKVQDRLKRIAAENGAKRTSLDASTAAQSSSQQPTSMWRSDEHLTREERRALKQANKLNVYDIGIRQNWRQVMGDEVLWWFVPVGEPKSDGHSFLVDLNKLSELERLTASIQSKDSRASSSSLHPSASASRGEGSTIASNTDWRETGQRTRGAHGEMVWGSPPRKSEWGVLYGIDDSDEEEGQHVLGDDASDGEQHGRAEVRHWS